MMNLYKTDLKRIFKDKLFLVASVIAAVFAVINPVFNKILMVAMGELDAELIEILGINAKTMFFSAFSLGNNLGLIAPILIGVALCKDFSFGTIRNKIICGKSRTEIFFSLFLSCFTVLCILMFAHALLTLGISLLLFEYQSDPFNLGDLWYLLGSCALELLVFLFVSAILAFLCVLMRSGGLTVVLYFAVNFFFSIVGTITLTASALIDPESKLISKILDAINSANVFTGAYIGIESYDPLGIIALILSTVIGTAAFVILGVYVFGKKDLK